MLNLNLFLMTVKIDDSCEIRKKIFRINMSELNGFCCCFLLTQRPLTIKNKKN